MTMRPIFVPACLALSLAVSLPGAAQASAASALCAPGAVAAAPNGGGSFGSGPVVVTGRWASAAKSSFHHFVSGLAGPVRLTLETCSSAAGGEAVAIYRATFSGERMPRKAPVIFSIAVPSGDVRTARAAIAPSSSISLTGTLRLAVEIENASGKFGHGAYRLTISR
jgi:hypothetical protein